MKRLILFSVVITSLWGATARAETLLSDYTGSTCAGGYTPGSFAPNNVGWVPIRMCCPPFFVCDDLSVEVPSPTPNCIRDMVVTVAGSFYSNVTTATEVDFAFEYTIGSSVFQTPTFKAYSDQGSIRKSVSFTTAIHTTACLTQGDVIQPIWRLPASAPAGLTLAFNANDTWTFSVVAQ